jgi:hypothetical protein
MRTGDTFLFPKTVEELNDWIPATRYVALNRDVLCVATTRAEGTWKAYCAAVPGQNHDEEWQAVLAQGCPMMADIAKIVFPDFAILSYAR